jgi:methyl-accepting chemotaxis protein
MAQVEHANVVRGSDMSEMNFATVKLAHSTWRMRLRAFLEGRENIDPKQLVSHQDCELGKWLYSAGLSKHGHLREIKELEKKHRIMHGIVRHVVDLKKAGKEKEADQEFAKVHDVAEGVVALLTSLEAQVK